VIGLEDEPARVEEQERAVRNSHGSPAARIEGVEVVALWERLSDLEEQPGLRLTFTTSDDSPAAISPLLARVTEARYVFRSAAGRLLVWTRDGEASEIVTLLAEFGFALIDVRGATGIGPPLSPQVAVRALRSRLREAIDPGARFAYGDRWVSGVF
jgi:hypothetical protein